MMDYGAMLVGCLPLALRFGDLDTCLMDAKHAINRAESQNKNVTHDYSVDMMEVTRSTI